MSKHWTPARPKVALKPSRIRREPVRLVSDVPAERKKVRRTDEQETWLGVAGILVLTVALAFLIIGISAATLFRDDPDAAARAKRFAQCYAADGPNCVLDGDTIYVQGAKVEIAGIAAPRIQSAKCDMERSRGIDSAVHLAEFLNAGEVTLGAPFREPSGRVVRNVEVKGLDVGQRMLNAGLARRAGDAGWC